MIYRHAERSDIKECCILKKEVIKRLNNEGLSIWNEEYPSDQLLEEDIFADRGRVIIIDKEIVAYATLSPILEEFDENTFNDSSFYCFSRLMVKTGFTNQHIATFLISSMLEEIKAKGIKGCGIMVHPINEKAIKMYQKLGFKFENRREYPYGDFITYSISL